MNILPSTINDIDAINQLYNHARALQKSKNAVQWPEFETTLIKTAIIENRQWKIMIDDKIACIWSTTFNDPHIWEERNKDPAVYIHRIATNPNFRGNNLVGEIVKWATNFAFENKKKFIRLDTVGENIRLIDYYQKCGFEFLGLCKLSNFVDLPAHYHNSTVSLFEIALL